MKRPPSRHKLFSVIEYRSFYAIRHNPTGKEVPAGDGVDTIFDVNDRPIPAGDPRLIPLWEQSLNSDPTETLEAYFPELTEEGPLRNPVSSRRLMRPANRPSRNVRFGKIQRQPSTIPTTKREPTKHQIAKIEREWTRLLKGLKQEIGDDYRCSDDPDDTTPGMQVTFGLSWDGEDLSWSYQTGDNSYSGGAYGHRHWGVVCLSRRSRAADVAADAMEQAMEALSQEVE